MKNQIKVRVWDRKRKGFLHNLDQMWDLVLADGVLSFLGGDRLDRNFEVQSFTGLLDKHGNEIYEGDILLDRVSSNVMDKEMDIFTVTYDETYCAFVLKRRSCESWNWIRNVSSHGELIGNIFET